MIAEFQWQGSNYSVDFSRGRSIALVLDPHGPQPSFFAEGPASARPLQVGDYIGDVQRGGSCNAEVLEWAPHCHGTHTECAGHLQRAAGSVPELIDAQPCIARVISLPAVSQPDRASDIELDVLQTALNSQPQPTPPALVLRTLPNTPDKASRDYAQAPEYPVLSQAAMQWLCGLGIRHLLLDTPSLDRADDGGTLTNHHLWWGLTDTTDPADPALKRSVTEMIFVPDELADGDYWLQLGLTALASDAVPSNPVLYPLERIDDAV